MYELIAIGILVPFILLIHCICLKETVKGPRVTQCVFLVKSLLARYYENEIGRKTKDRSSGNTSMQLHAGSTIDFNREDKPAPF